MEPLVMYLLKANVLISILFLFYLLMLKNEKFFKLNRFYLLFSLLITLFLPLLPKLKSSHLEPIQRQFTTANPLNDLYKTIGNSQTSIGPVNTSQIAVDQASAPASLIQILGNTYLLVSGVLLVLSILKVLQICMLIKKTEKHFKAGVYYCVFDETAPFSFFNYLVINKELFNDGELSQIIAHENVHIRQWHSLDILLAEVVHAVLWINPLLLHLKRFIKLNHEYIADEEIISSGVDKKNYQLTILHNSLKLHHSHQLTNLFSSSKIKLRIKMMNQKKSNTNAYKYVFVLLLVATSYFLINPLSASAIRKHSIRTDQALKKFEGYYKMKGKKDIVIQIMATGNGLLLKQLWNDRQIDFTSTGPLTFFVKDDPSFTLKFTGNDAGRITHFLAFGKDVWIKSDNYSLPGEVKLTAQDLKKFEGYYELKGKKESFTQISSTSNGLVLTQLWDNKKIDFVAKSPLEFFVKTTPGFTLQFTGDNAGHISKFLAFEKDTWIKSSIQTYHPPVEIKLTTQELKKLEGKYELAEKKGIFIEITSKNDGLILKQSWDNKQLDFAAKGPLAFFAKTNTDFTLQFTASNTGEITKVLALGKDVWNKVN